MLQKTKGIVLRSVKYGETSLVTTMFTYQYGIQIFMVQGVRTSTKKNRSGSFQPATLLDLVVYEQHQKNMQRIREFQPAYIYQSLQEDVIKNSIVLFSVEVMLRLLPEHAPLPALFDFAFEYFITLDKMQLNSVANFPLFFIIQCSKVLGYELKGKYSKDTPHLDMHDGGFTEELPGAAPFMNEEDAIILDQLISANTFAELQPIEINGTIRLRLIDWYIAFLQLHTQHMSNIKSLTILKQILH